MVDLIDFIQLIPLVRIIFEMNFDKLMETKHILQWFSNEPFKEIAVKVEQMFIQQSSSTKLLDFVVTSEP